MIGTETLTYDQFKAKKKRREVTYPLVTDDDAAVAYRLAEEHLRKARASGTPAAVKAAQQDVEVAEKALRDATMLLRLRALPRKGDKSYQALRAEHPPTAEDNDKAAEFMGEKVKAHYHADTFGPALVAACLIEPQVTVEQAAEMAAEMNEAEWDQLFATAIMVNTQATDTAGLVFS